MPPFLRSLALLAALASSALAQQASDAPPPIAREFRGAWVASVANIDWPSKPGLTAWQQKSELIAILDRSVELNLNAVLLQVRPGSDTTARHAVLSGWYREILKAAVPPLIAAWEPRLGVSAHGFFVQQMKTKWGSCNPTARTIRLNTELAKKPSECLEYLVLHEIVHLIEPTHNARFVALMTQFMPDWRHRKQTLNRLPIGHPAWAY